MLSRTDFWAASIVSSSLPLDSPNSGLLHRLLEGRAPGALVGVVQLAPDLEWIAGRLARFVGLRHRCFSFSVRRLVAAGRRVAPGPASVQTEEAVDRLAIGIEHRRRGLQPGMAGVGDRVDPPGGTGRPGLPGRLEEAVLLHLAERPVQRAHRDPEQAERSQVVLDHVAVRPLERDGQQDERRQEVARRPAGKRLALLDRLGLAVSVGAPTTGPGGSRCWARSVAPAPGPPGVGGQVWRRAHGGGGFAVRHG